MSSSPRVPLAVVSAGDTGVGLAVVRRLAADGMEIVIASRHPDRAAGVVADLVAQGSAASVAEVDVTDPASVHRAFASVDSVDVLVNAAGSHSRGTIEELSLEEFERILRPSVSGAFLMCKRALALMEHGSRIVNMTSLSMQGCRSASHYASAKAGIIGLTRALAAELLPRGIRANAVAPSLLDTQMSRRSLGEEGLAAAAAGSPGERLVTVEEVAEVVAFLCSPRSSGITGQCLIVDNGMTLPRW